MNSRARAVLVLLAAALLPWLGSVQAMPHRHAEASISQEVLACSASGGKSHEVHLHQRGHLLPPHLCLACLAGAFHAASPSLVSLEGGGGAAPLDAGQPPDVRSRGRAQLPLVRGPPVAV